MRLFNTKNIFFMMVSILPLSILQANPGFSRQIGMECMACHNQTMNQLNSFGRKFAASGFTKTVGNQAMIDGSTIKLGLPSSLNASVLLKARYLKFEPETSKQYEDVGMERGNLELWKVSKLFFGGKVAENVGALVKVDYAGFGAKVIFSHEFGSGYAGISAYSDDDFGPFGGGESYNTGLYPPLRLFENRKATNAAQATELGHGPATGIQAYYSGETLSVMGGAYVPASSEHEGLDVGDSLIPIGRIAVAPTFGDWTIMAGAFGLDGTTKLSDMALDNTKPQPGDAELIEITRKAYGLDAQIEGNIAGMSTVLTLNAVLKNETKLYNSTTGTNLDDLTGTSGAGTTIYNGEDYVAGDNRAFSAELQVNPWDVLGFKVAYLHYDDRYDYRYTAAPEGQTLVDKFDRDDYTIGLDYVYRQNVRFVFEYTYSDYAENDRTASSLSDSDNYLLSATIGF